MTHNSESMTAKWASPWGVERRRVMAARSAALAAEREARAVEREAAALERRRVTADAEAARRRALPAKTAGRWATAYAAPPARHPQAIRRDRERMERYRQANYPWFKEEPVKVAGSASGRSPTPAGVLAGIPSATRF